MTLTPEQVQEIKQGVEKVVSHVKQNVKKADAEDIPEMVATEIVGLCEWLSKNKELNGVLASAVLKAGGWDMDPKVAMPVRKYFSLTY